MTAAALAQTNGSHSNGFRPMAPPSDPWLQSSVQQFFTAFNWENQTPQVQQIKLVTAPLGDSPPLSMTLSVSQFLGAFNWDGAEVAAASTSLDDPLFSATADDGFTLDGFSDLF
jgi:hypothetical protein